LQEEADGAGPSFEIVCAGLAGMKNAKQTCLTCFPERIFGAPVRVLRAGALEYGGISQSSKRKVYRFLKREEA
jgi:hypothetical protein